MYGVWPGQSWPLPPPPPLLPVAVPVYQPPPLPSVPRPPPPPQQQQQLEYRPPPVVPAVRPRGGPPPVRRPIQPPAPPPVPQQHAAPMPPSADTPPHFFPQQQTQPKQRELWPPSQPHQQQPLQGNDSWGSRGPPPADFGHQTSASQTRFDTPRNHATPYGQSQQAVPSRGQWDDRSKDWADARGYSAQPTPVEQGRTTVQGWEDHQRRDSGYGDGFVDVPRDSQGGFGVGAARGGRGKGPWQAAGGFPTSGSSGRSEGPGMMSIMYDGKQVRGGAGEGPFGVGR